MRAFSLSDRGPVRNENQDHGQARLLRAPKGVLLAVCDGMGGANSGALASAIALETYQNQLEAVLKGGGKNQMLLSHWMREACAAANAAVYERAADPAHSGMGTTLVAAAIFGRRAEILHVGDSRAYLIRGRRLTQLTRDHSLVAELVAAGNLTPEEAEHHPQKNIITRAVGVEPAVEPELTSLRLRAGDRLLLCSDGLSNTLSRDELVTLSRASRNPAAVCQSLVERACALGARDNVTAAIAIL